VPDPTFNRPPVPSSRRRRLVGAELERCIFCGGSSIRREGKRQKKHETIQLWYCRDCDRVFTPQRAKGKTYPLKVVLEALMHYYRGDTRAQAAKRIAERFDVTVPSRTLSNWIAEYRELTTYARLREDCAKLFRPNRVIRSVRLHHQQVYEYRIHQGKLATILATAEHQRFRIVEKYLFDMVSACPHGLFQSDSRASQGRTTFDLNAVAIKSKRNHACRLADCVLQTVTHNKRRHDELQRFMLTTDSVTVAVEVPVYLTVDELAELKATQGFTIPIEASSTLTGHIDVLQIRHGAIHILDYKPHAKSEKPIAQLMVYALALSRRTGLRIFDFVCAWFDEHHYYEFYPLHVVHKRRNQSPHASPVHTSVK
jgi:transposase-like protein